MAPPFQARVSPLCLLPLLLILSTTIIALCSAFELPLPGGRSVSYSPKSGVLRIDVVGSSKSGGEKPPSVPPADARPSRALVEESIEVRLCPPLGMTSSSRSRRGYGAYATAPIPKSTFLGWYEGEVIRGGREQLDKHIKEREQDILRQWRVDGDGNGEVSDGQPDRRTGAMDYVLSLDGGMTFLDGYDRATSDRGTFTPAHLNHADNADAEGDSDSGCSNCVRVLNDHADAVAFFTKRRVRTGEELRFDYGKSFWRDRMDEKEQ